MVTVPSVPQLFSVLQFTSAPAPSQKIVAAWAEETAISALPARTMRFRREDFDFMNLVGFEAGNMHLIRKS